MCKGPELKVDFFFPLYVFNDTWVYDMKGAQWTEICSPQDPLSIQPKCFKNLVPKNFRIFPARRDSCLIGNRIVFVDWLHEEKKV